MIIQMPIQTSGQIIQSVAEVQNLFIELFDPLHEILKPTVLRPEQGTHGPESDCQQQRNQNFE
jgi:hypothetical protein